MSTAVSTDTNVPICTTCAVEHAERIPVCAICADERQWVARPDEAIRPWSGDLEILPGVTLTQPGGHFPGSAVAHWAPGRTGAVCCSPATPSTRTRIARR